MTEQPPSDQPPPQSEYTLRNTVWADEGGIQLHIRKGTNGRVIVEVVNGELTTRATVAGYRWQRLMEALND